MTTVDYCTGSSSAQDEAKRVDLVGISEGVQDPAAEEGEENVSEELDVLLK
jgi:hypothetical protein